MEELFKLGQIIMTTNFMNTLGDSHAKEAHDALALHVTGDWGDVCFEDGRSNIVALENDNRLMSVYHSAVGIKFWVITEWDRSVTTLLLPEDY